MIYEEELLAGNGTHTIAEWRTKRLKPSALKALRSLAHHEQAQTASQIAGDARLSASTAREVAKAFVAHGYADRVAERVSGRAAYRITTLGQEAALAAKIIAAQDEGARLSAPAFLERQEIDRALAAKEVTMREIRSMRAKKRPGKHRVVLGPNGERAREMVGPHRWSDPWHVCKSCGRHHTLREHRHHKHDGERYRVSMGGALFPGDPVPKDPPFEFTMFNPPPAGIEFSVESRKNGTIEILAIINMKSVGTIVVMPRYDMEDAVVVSILVVEKWRRQHVATALYQKAAEVVSRYGLDLSSDTMREPAAEAFWLKQKIKGRATYSNGRYTLKEMPPKSLENPLDEEMRRAERSGDSAKLERMKARALGQQCLMIACKKPAVELFYLKWYGEEVPLCREHLDFAKRPAGSDENPRRARQNPLDEEMRRAERSGDDPAKLERMKARAFGEPVRLWSLPPGTVFSPDKSDFFENKAATYTVIKHYDGTWARVTRSDRPGRESDVHSAMFVWPKPSSNPRRARPWAKTSVENRTPLIPFDVFRDQEFMPIWRRAVASGKIPPSIIAQHPTVLLTEQLTQLHCKNSRRYAQVIPNRLQFEFALQTLWLPAVHRGGLIAHEIGHVLAPEGSEDDADRMALKVLGIKVTYDKRWPGKGLQKGRVVR